MLLVRCKGFTIIELLIVVMILGSLSAAYAAYNSNQDRKYEVLRTNAYTVLSATHNFLDKYCNTNQIVTAQLLVNNGLLRTSDLINPFGANLVPTVMTHNRVSVTALIAGGMPDSIVVRSGASYRLNNSVVFERNFSSPDLLFEKTYVAGVTECTNAR